MEDTETADIGITKSLAITNLSDNNRKKPLRFMDLPLELREMVYKELLCSVPPRPERASFDEIDQMAQTPMATAKRSIDTSILRVSRQIHREAYDFMVKTNKFVVLGATGEFTILSLLRTGDIPIFGMGEGPISKCKSAVLTVVFSTNKHWMTNAHHHHIFRPVTVVMLARDLDLLCDSLLRCAARVPMFPAKVCISIDVAPVLDHRREHYQDSLLNFFSETIQESLLQPFRSHLRGFTDVKVQGRISPQVEANLKNTIAKFEWTDSVGLLKALKLKKDEARAEFGKGHLRVACDIWVRGSWQISRVQLGGSWSSLLASSNQSFIDKIAEIKLTFCLNAIHGFLTMWNPKTTTMSDAAQLGAPAFIHDIIDDAHECMTTGYWRDGYRYQPPDLLFAKLCYRHAMFLRLWGMVSEARTALTHITYARDLLPDDSKISEEFHEIMHWVLAAST